MSVTYGEIPGLITDSMVFKLYNSTGGGTTNLLTYPNTFINYWGGYCGTVWSNVTANTGDVAAPNGTYTATKFYTPVTGCFTSPNYTWGAIAGPNLTTNRTYTVSVWAKGANGGEGFFLGINDSHATTVTLSTTWTRYSYTKTNITNGSRTMEFYSVNQTYYVWNAQVEEKSSAYPYTPTTYSAYWGDSTGNGYDGIMVGSASYDSGTTSVSFNGSTDYITEYTFPDSSWNAGSWTVSAWAYFTSVNKGTDNAIISSGSAATNNGLHIGERSGYAYFGFYNNDLSGTVAIGAGAWKNIVCTYNYSTKLKQIYVNGAFDTSGGSVGYGGTGGNTEIGRYVFATTHLMYGKLSTILFYNRVLTSTEIARNYNATKSNFGL